MKTESIRAAGFTLVEIMIVVAIIGLLATIAVPTWVRARTHSQAQACINNLKQIDGAKQQWALENREPDTATPGAGDVLPYLKNEVLCPTAGTDTTFTGSYSLNQVGTKPTCLKVAETHVLPVTTSN